MSTIPNMFGPDIPQPVAGGVPAGAALALDDPEDIVDVLLVARDAIRVRPHACGPYFADEVAGLSLTAFPEEPDALYLEVPAEADDPDRPPGAPRFCSSVVFVIRVPGFTWWDAHALAWRVPTPIPDHFAVWYFVATAGKHGLFRDADSEDRATEVLELATPGNILDERQRETYALSRELQGFLPPNRVTAFLRVHNIQDNCPELANGTLHAIAEAAASDCRDQRRRSHFADLRGPEEQTQVAALRNLPNWVALRSPLPGEDIADVPMRELAPDESSRHRVRVDIDPARITDAVDKIEGALSRG